MGKSKFNNPHIRTKHSFLKILTGSDLSRRRLPFITVESVNPGPLVWLTACAHGDEVGGVVIIQEILKRIRKNLLRGSVYTFPLMNPIGFETSSRDITLSEEDLNRAFPGNKNGSLAERIADKIFITITQTNPTLVLDLHNDWIKSIPYTLIDLYSGDKYKEMYERTKVFSKKTGLLVVLDTEEIEKTLSYNLIQHNIPALTLELGEAYVVNEKNIEYGVKSIWNVLTYLEMVKPTNELFSYPMATYFRDKILKYSHKPLSSTSGIIRFLVKQGDVVRKGQPVAKIYNTFGKPQETLRALDDGVVLRCTDFSVAFPGVPVIAFGVI